MLLNYLIPQKAQQTREDAVSFENSLSSEFRSLTMKSGENVKKVEDQLDLLIEQAEKENDIANRIAKLSAMFSKNALLESLVYSKLNDKLDQFPKKIETDVEVKQPVVISKPKDSKDKPKSPIPKLPQQKLSGGGINTPIGYDSSDKFDSKAIPYANNLKLSLQASGIAAITTLGEFIKGTGALGGFFAPYLRSVVRPFALALGVNQNIINTTIGGPVNKASLELRDQQRYFGKTWGKFLSDNVFVSKYIDRESTTLEEKTPTGYVPAKWDEDPEFVALVNAFAREWNLNANGLLALMASESGIDPARYNSRGCVGLIQFCPGGGLGGTGKTAAELAAMTRSQQWPYVINYWIQSGLEKGMTAGDIYGLTHVPNWYKTAVEGKPIGSPERMSAVVVTSADGAAYSSNDRLDFDQDGKITVQDYDDEVRRVGKSFKIEYEKGGSNIRNTTTPLSPYLMTGPDAGYNVNIQGYDVTLHGDEVIVPFSSGFQVYPISNRRYDVEKDPVDVAKRWKQISSGDNINSAGTAQGGGTKKTVSNLGKDYKYWELFYARQAAYSQIGTKRQGSSGTGYAPSIVSRWNTKSNYRRSNSYSQKSKPSPKVLVKTETDIMMDQYKQLIAMGKHTEAKDLGMRIWNKTWKKTDIGLERIPETTSPKTSSASPIVTASSDKTSPRVIVNQIGSSSSLSTVAEPPHKNTIIQLEVINYNRFKNELNMKRIR